MAAQTQTPLVQEPPQQSRVVVHFPALCTQPQVPLPATEPRQTPLPQSEPEAQLTPDVEQHCKPANVATQRSPQQSASVVQKSVRGVQQASFRHERVQHWSSAPQWSGVGRQAPPLDARSCAAVARSWSELASGGEAATGAPRSAMGLAS